MGVTSKELVATYDLLVYKDGSVDVKRKREKEEKTTKIEKVEVSSRIGQILRVIELSLEEYTEKKGSTHSSKNFQLAFEISKIVTSAVAKTAEELEITRNSVMDKIGRQLSLKHSDFLSMLLDFFQKMDNENELENIVLKHISARSSEAADVDEDAVKEAFKEFRTILEAL